MKLNAWKSLFQMFTQEAKKNNLLIDYMMYACIFIDCAVPSLLIRDVQFADDRAMLGSTESGLHTKGNGRIK